MANEVDYIEFGLFCADVCKALARGVEGRRLNQLSRSVLEAIGRLTATVDEIQRKIVKQSKRNVVIRLFHAKNDKETIAVWNLEFNRALQILHIELAINNTLTVADIRRRERRSRFFGYLWVGLGLSIGAT